MISDATARIQALNPEASCIVQAPAGSGKTGLLVHRMLALLARVEQPQQVLALTFTRKATAEMRERLLQLISKAQANESSNKPFEQCGIELAWAVVQRDQELGWHLLDSPHQLQILTIDAFCARLTASMPWLSRLGDRPRTTDSAEKYYAAAVEQLFSELLQGDSKLSRALQTVMLEIDYDYNRARRLFTAMLAKRDQWLRHILSNDLVGLRATLEYAWQTISSEQLAILNNYFSANQLQEIVALATTAASRIETKEGVPSPLQAFELFNKSIRLLGLPQWQALRFFLCGKGKTIRKQINKKIGFPPGDPLKPKFAALLAELENQQGLCEALIDTDPIPAQQFANHDWQQLLALEEVLKALAGLLQLQFRSAGECDHTEVSQRANLALQELQTPTDLALRMDYQLQHILVDEFQDTSHGQVELLKRLTEGWSRDQLGPGKTLFLVGDPMQSIYRFREADVSLFLRVTQNATTQVFENIDIQSLTLSENFRSDGSLVEWFNETFQIGFPRQNAVLSGAIRYSPASSNKACTAHRVHYHLANSRAEETQLTIAAVKAAIADLPDEQSRVALLVRGRGQLKQLIPALNAHGIAYQGVDIRPLKDQQAVIDVIALCKALCHEDNRVSWLALLRGPWCGLSLVEIMALAGQPNQTLWQQLRQFKEYQSTLTADSLLRLERFLSVMEKAMQQRQQVDLASLTRWTWQALGGRATLFETPLQDVETVFNLIQSLQQAGDLVSVAELDQAAAQLYAEPSGDPQARLVVSTIHKAKGLQYHTVILPTLSNPPGANNKEIMMWAEHQSNRGESLLLMAPLCLNEAQGSHYQYLRELDKKRARNEAIRLMYVACTRAEHKLVLLAHVSTDEATGEFKKINSNTLLATIWEAVESGFAQSRSEIEWHQPSNETIIYNQTLKRLPGDYAVRRANPVLWQAASQLSAQDPEHEIAQIGPDWSTEVATAIGVVMHDWLQFNQSRLFDVALTETLLAQWRAQLRALKVPPASLGYGVERLSLALRNMQDDELAQFLFANHAEQHNEYSLVSCDNGTIKTHRIDRTFIGPENTRWIIDYKTSNARTANVEAFVDHEVQQRHRLQLENYGRLMQQLDSRPIKLAVYFPMLARMRSWDYQP